MRLAEKEKKKFFVPSSVHTRFGEENSENHSKKIQKFKNPLSSIVFSQNEKRQAEKEKKKFLVPNSVFTRPGQENSEKINKKFKKLKNLIPELFLAKT